MIDERAQRVETETSLPFGAAFCFPDNLPSISRTWCPPMGDSFGGEHGEGLALYRNIAGTSRHGTPVRMSLPVEDWIWHAFRLRREALCFEWR
ncbi:hypothetical protein [Nocardia nova]|uniref:hypothetical protein n=1 Tax=Nocardia nova TaxID=37330 RepID=UPI0015E3F5E7|nr:hypothetical protein [Nocardia nova]